MSMSPSRCEICGNEYERAMEIRIAGGDTHLFDCFECAVHALAPSCAQCGCRILGHGVEASGRLFCGAHCAHEAGFDAARDHV